MKALRRSIKGEKEKGPQVSIAPKSAVAIVPPKKVIRALYDYEAQQSQELSFSRGDFFHVIGRENDTDWYEACNPALPDARGLVPVAFFQALGRTERDSAQSDSGPRTSEGNKIPDHDSGFAEDRLPMSPPATISAPAPAPAPAATAAASAPGHRVSKSIGKTGSMVYGIVMYDFQAERPDELEAKAGEAIIVIAQSNPEWFVAKPIGRLGGPGLIPVSFIEIRDMGTDKAVPNPGDAIKRAGVPRVEEWKKMTAEYKNSSITLGKFDNGAAPGSQQSIEQGMERMSMQQQSAMRQSQQQPNYPYSQQQSPQQQQRNTQQGQPSQPYGFRSGADLLAPVAARIPRYCFAEDKYWFVVETTLEDGRQWELSRYYEDFYDFQIALLTEFPNEAGNTGTQKRTLPYMPGPVNYVTDAITEGRLHNLDMYVKNLLGQPEYIARCILVKQFFAPREGDYETDGNNGDEYRLSGGSRSSTDSPRDGSSRQSSKNNLNGQGYGGLSAAPKQMQQNGQPPMHRQGSSMSQPASSSAPQQAQAANGPAFKVKLFFNGDTFLIRVPADTDFPQLYEKIRERTKVSQNDQIQLLYRDERSGDKLSLMSNNDLNYALDNNEKLVIYVEQV